VEVSESEVFTSSFLGFGYVLVGDVPKCSWRSGNIDFWDLDVEGAVFVSRLAADGWDFGHAR